MELLWISIFGVAGVLARYAVSKSIQTLFTPSWPLSTFAINMLGSFLIGVLYVHGVEKGMLPPHMRLALAVGFLGGFTTFSAFSLETFQLIEQNRIPQAILYATASPLFGVIAALGGAWFARK